MTDILAFRTAIVETISAKLPDLRDCSGHGGQFTLEELRRWASQAPGVKVAVLSLTPGGGVSGGWRDYKVRCAAVVVTRDAIGLPRDQSVLVISQTLIELIYQNTWGLDPDFCFAADAAAGKSLYSSDLDRQGVALWQVQWEQKLRLPVRAGTDPVTPQLYVSMAPEIGAEHEDDYIEVGAAQ